jgi:lysophospholipase L1-like esterase
MDMKGIAFVALAVAAALAAEAKPAYQQQTKAEEVKARGGVPNLVAKLKAGKPVTIAYLGGSITAMDGWRNKTTAWFRKTYPNNTFTEVHASIGGTGSDLGAFRVGRDALRHKPDLLFVEFATNDGGAAPEAIWRSMEGIVRQTWKADPTTDIVFTYTITTAFTNDYSRGLCNRSASAMEMLADHYAIPSVNFGPRVTSELAAGRLVMTPPAAAVPTAVPGAKDTAGAARPGAPLVFANDGVHPGDGGHELYLASITNAFTRMLAGPAGAAHTLPAPFVADNWEAAKMVPVTQAMLKGSWEKLPETDGKMKAFSNRMGQIWYSGTPGSSLTFKFKGTLAQVYDLLGPDGGQVDITVDGKPAARPVPRFDSYCTYHRIATLHAASFPEPGEHTVTITVDAKQPDRHSVAFRLKDPAAELAAPKFQGTKVWFSQLMLIGDLEQAR